MSDLEIRNIDGVDVVRFLPQGVCSKVMELRVKDDIIQSFEAVGGCSGNLQGIARLVQGANIHDVVSRLKGIPCGSRPTSCPDQLSICIQAYINEKAKITA